MYQNKQFNYFILLRFTFFITSPSNRKILIKYQLLKIQTFFN